MKTHLSVLALAAALVACDAADLPGDGPGAVTPELTLSRAALVFNAGGDVASDSRSLQLTNTGAGPLNISELGLSGPDAAQFALADAAPFTLAAGSSRELTVTFTPLDSDLGPQIASLTVAADELETSLSVSLGGLSVLGQEGTNEPSVQWIFDTFGFGVQTGDTDPATSAIVEETTNDLVGDEVLAQTFTRADPAQPVTAQVLATFAVPDVEPVFEFGFYGASAAEPALQQLLSLPIGPGLNGQRLEPAISPTAATVAEGVVSFEPPAEPFGFYSDWPTTRFFEQRTVFTEDARNVFPNAIPHHVRVFPLKERDGTVAENAYILVTDESQRLDDYNDAVVLVRNVRPAQTSR